MARLAVATFLLLVPFVAAFDADTLSTLSGAPIDDGRRSLTAGERGPTLIQDSYLIERLSVHNRERIPERNVHARGSTAKGYFEVTNDEISKWTYADVFSEKGKRTPAAVRFSTVVHGVGSPTFLRDPRGFAVKLYTSQGNYDMVGNNMPVFFVRDGIKFPEMVRALKPNPVTDHQELWRILDYFASVGPECLHMFTWWQDDAGIPYTYRYMDGWPVHAFKWINADGEERLVRYFWKSEQGVRFLLDDEAPLQHFSYHAYDLYEAIRTGDFPSWKLYVQIMNLEDQYNTTLGFDPLDSTTVWPESLYPQIEIGRLVLNENVKNQFLENEQIAFAPSRLVPGVEASSDRLLQARLFSYPDAQMYRLGVNNQLLPINRPKCPYADQHVDGAMNFLTENYGGETNYFPSAYTPLKESPRRPHAKEPIHGVPSRTTPPASDPYAQPRARYLSFAPDRQERFAIRLAAGLASERLKDEIRSQWFTMWDTVDARLGKRVRKLTREMMRAESESQQDNQEGSKSFSANGEPDWKAIRANYLRAAGAY